MATFQTLGKENTKEAVTIAVNKAIEMNTDLVLASSRGTTAYQTKEIAEELGFKGKVIVITLAYNSGNNAMDEKTRKDLQEKGIILVTGAHVLSGAERGLSKKYGGISPVEVMADTLRMFSRGVKVCVEVAVMANDAGLIEYGKPVVCIGGSGGGADSVCIITPANAANILETKINEIIIKPFVG